jgi:hypothetical protein
MPNSSNPMNGASPPQPNQGSSANNPKMQSIFQRKKSTIQTNLPIRKKNLELLTIQPLPYLRQSKLFHNNPIFKNSLQFTVFFLLPTNFIVQNIFTIFFFYL